MALTTSYLGISRFTNKFGTSPTLTSYYSAFTPPSVPSPLYELQKSFAYLQSYQTSVYLAALLSKIQFPTFEYSNLLLDAIFRLQYRVGYFYNSFTLLAAEISSLSAKANAARFMQRSLQVENARLYAQFEQLSNTSKSDRAELDRAKTILDYLLNCAYLESPENLLSWAIATKTERDAFKAQFEAIAQNNKTTASQTTEASNNESVAQFMAYLGAIKYQLNELATSMTLHSIHSTVDYLAAALSKMPAINKTATDVRIIAALRDYQRLIDTVHARSYTLLLHQTNGRSEELETRKATHSARANVFLENAG